MARTVVPAIEGLSVLWRISWALSTEKTEGAVRRIVLDEGLGGF